MATSRPLPLLLCFVIALSLSCFRVAASGDVEVVSMTRKIDLTSQTVRMHIVLTVKTVSQEPVREVYLGLPARQVAGIGFLRAAAIEGAKDDRFIGLDIGLAEPTGGDGPSNVSFLSLKLHTPLPPGKTAKLEAYLALSRQVAPFPAEIGQDDKQLLLFRDTHYAIVPYHVKQQTTALTLDPSSAVESFTRKDPHTRSGPSIRLGPYADVAPMTASPLEVHYSFARPLLVAARLLREVEVSHWGNVYVTESYELRHDGAKLKGSFSRLDFQARPGENGAARLLFSRLPPRARSVYYRDEIGNISTSRFIVEPFQMSVELEPRYPLVGGWSIAFTLGYSVPLEDVVFRAADGRRALNMTFGCQLADVVAEELVVKVILPEGSSRVEAFTPFPTERASERRFTYLDVGGRPVVVLSRENVVGEFAGLYFQVLYKFAPLALLAEPLLLVAAFAALFAACVAYVRCDFAISRATPAYQAAQQKELVVDRLQQLQKALAARAAAGERLTRSLHQLARSGDAAAAKAARKAEEASLKESGKEVRGIVEQLEGLPRPPPVLPKVQALVAKEKEMQDKLLQKHAVTLEAFERQLPPKDIDGRVLPIQQRLTQLKLEVRDLMLALED